MRFRKIKRFFRPNIINISLAFLCIGLTLKFIVPILAFIKIIPCKVFPSGTMSLCPINPINPESTYYLGFALGDHFYLLLYLFLIVVVIPYTLSCAIFHFYYAYIRRILSR